MDLYVILYHHSYGVDCTAQYFDHPPSQEEMMREMEIDLEEEEFLESVCLDSARLRLPLNRKPCSRGCPGWMLEESSFRIEKCDACKRFKSDEEAVNYVRALETWDVIRHDKGDSDGDQEAAQTDCGRDL
jgi:hypothetical protein